mmetsp:Transcript_14383/g.30977  ORF Transcript_14383/g.30977 Transcript_14383/m.30977 type:complete len:237 (-) Transcript_14383:324-1034(-)
MSRKDRVSIRNLLAHEPQPAQSPNKRLRHQSHHEQQPVESESTRESLEEKKPARENKSRPESSNLQRTQAISSRGMEEAPEVAPRNAQSHREPDLELGVLARDQAKGREAQETGANRTDGSASSPSFVHKRWTAEEDALLIRLADQYGPKPWKMFAEKYFGGQRTPGSIRSRYVNNLCPGRELRPWTKEEDEALLVATAQHGNRWCQIAEMFEGRVANDVKNRMQSLLERSKRLPD